MASKNKDTHSDDNEKVLRSINHRRTSVDHSSKIDAHKESSSILDQFLVAINPPPSIVFSIKLELSDVEGANGEHDHNT